MGQRGGSTIIKRIVGCGFYNIHNSTSYMKIFHFDILQLSILWIEQKHSPRIEGRPQGTIKHL